MLEKFLIVLTKSAEKATETLNEVFKIVMKLGLLSVNVLIEEKNSTWTLHLYKPYFRNCYSFEIIKLNTFTIENYTNELEIAYTDLYPSELIKFPNCPLFISTFSLKPFVIVKGFKNGTEIYSGLDVEITNEISKTLNLNPIYMQATDKTVRGLIFSNGTITGAMGMVRIESNYNQYQIKNRLYSRWLMAMQI